MSMDSSITEAMSSDHHQNGSRNMNKELPEKRYLSKYQQKYRLARKTIPGGGPRRIVIAFRTDPRVYHKLRECATLALSDYNSQMHTNYRFVDLEHAMRYLGRKYYLIFQASTSEELNTFEANVIIRKVQRGVRSLQVDRVLIRKPGSIWRAGTLRELLPFGYKRRSPI